MKKTIILLLCVASTLTASAQRTVESIRKEYQAVNLSLIQKLAEQGAAKVGVAELVAAGAAKAGQLIKVLGKGQLTAKVDVEAHAFSKTAEAAIQAAGGNATTL